MRLQNLILASVLLLGLSACGPKYRSAPSGITAAIKAPSSAKVGEVVSVSLTTSGASSCWQADRVQVNVDHEQRRVEFFPFVKAEIAPKYLCSALVVDLPIEATFTPQVAGTYLLEAKGSRFNGRTTEPYTWTTEIVVTE